MANLFRLIFVSLLLFASSAQAVETCTPENYPFSPRMSALGMQYGTWACGYGGAAPTACGYTWQSWDGAKVITIFESKCTMQPPPPTECTAGRERNADGVCACKAGSIEPASGTGQCISQDQVACFNLSAIGRLLGGALVEPQRLTGNIPNGTSFCLPMTSTSSPNIGCKVTFDRDALLDYGSGNAVSEGTYSMHPDSNLIDQSCSLKTTAPLPEDPPKLPPPVKEKCTNGYSGSVNGVDTCVNKVPDSGVGGDSSETTTDDGTNTTTKRTNNSTTCKDGVCTTVTTTTTTTTNNTTGTSTTATTTKTSTDPQGGFCKDNPGNKLCDNGDGEGSVFTGSCSAGFQCEGDAIQCAISREQHRRACKLFDDQSPESILYNENKNKTGNQTNELPGNATVAVNGRISTADALNAGSAGVSDLNITVMGKSITLPFSILNQYLGYLGNILLAVSFLLALRIITRG